MKSIRKKSKAQEINCNSSTNSKNEQQNSGCNGDNLDANNSLLSSDISVQSESIMNEVLSESPTLIENIEVDEVGVIDQFNTTIDILAQSICKRIQADEDAKEAAKRA